MTSIIRRMFLRGGPNENVKLNDISGEMLVEDDKISDTPYIAASIFYLFVILFIGVPMWFYTCSVTRYTLPNLTNLEIKLMKSDNSPPKLHLDISLVQLSRYDASKSDDDIAQLNDHQATYLRTNLPYQINTSIENVTYNINWRVRRPTHDENRILKLHQKDQQSLMDNGQLTSALQKLESDLIKIHKPANRFRLFMYLIEEPYYSSYCDQSRIHTYTVGFERFVYLCPSNALKTNENYESTVSLINDVLNEIYSNTVNQQRVKHALNGQMDLLFSLLPESSDPDSLSSIISLGKKIHQIYDKNVKDRFPELKELLNVRLITQNVVGLLDDKLISKITSVQKKNESSTNSKDSRILLVNQIGQLFHKFESRLNTHSTQNVHNVLTIVPDSNKSSITLSGKVSKEADTTDRNFNILEGQDSNSMLVASNDKCLVLGIRAIVRRVMALSNANVCKNCLVRRDVFFTRWEVDAIMGVLTITKLYNTLLSLRSISQQVVSIKIPKDVAVMASEAYDLSIKSIEQLETKRTLESYRLASKAYELSESAFFDPSLLESLYFPDDTKYAIYLPLFLPLAFPLATSIVRLITFLFTLLKGKPISTKVKIN